MAVYLRGMCDDSMYPHSGMYVMSVYLRAMRAMTLCTYIVVLSCAITPCR